jgi:2-dehydropantoate 2-reductase
VLWDKFLFITGIGGVTALARSGSGPLLASAAGHSLLRVACEEIVAVAEAEGAHLQPAAVDAVLAQAVTLPSPWRSSMARDLEEGRRLEVDALSGAVVRRGTKHGIPTPVHQAIVACLPRHQPSASTMQGTQARSAIRA